MQFSVRIQGFRIYGYNLGLGFMVNTELGLGFRV